MEQLVWRLANESRSRDTYESVACDGDTAQDAHSWSDREERDGYEARMQEMESKSQHSFSWTTYQRFLP